MLSTVQLKLEIKHTLTSLHWYFYSVFSGWEVDRKIIELTNSTAHSDNETMR